MVLEAVDEVICRSEPFIIGSGGTPCASEVAALTRHSVRWANQDTYFGAGWLRRKLGRVWRVTAEGGCQHETLIRDLLDDQYSRPTRIVAFNTAEGWSRDVTVDIADELRRRLVRLRARF